MQTLPTIGEKATVAGVSFPLTVESFSEATRSAALKGEHPETGMDVLVPKVCLSQLFPPDATATHKPGIGDYARLKSYGPLMTVTEVRPPAPDAPEGAGTMVVCQYFEGAELFEHECDARTLFISDKRCAV